MKGITIHSKRIKLYKNLILEEIEEIYLLLKKESKFEYHSEDRMKKGLVKKLFILVTSMSTILISIFLSDNTNNTVYQYLFLLPLLHGGGMIIFFSKAEEMLKYPSQKIIYALFFIRNVVTPLLLVVNNYNLGIIIRDKSDVNYSIFLMLYETFMVFLVLSQEIRLKKRNISHKASFLDKKAFVQNLFNFLLISLAIITLILWIIVPELKKSYGSIFDLTNLIQVANNVVKDDLATSTRALATIGGMLLTFCRIFVSLWILYKIRMRSSSVKVGVFAALIITVFQMLFIGAQLMFAFYILFFIFFTTIKLWPGSRKFMSTFFGIIILFGIIWVPFVKGGFTSWNSFLRDLGGYLQAYLPGIANVAGTVRIEKVDLLKTGFADIYTMIPFRNTLFGLQVENLSDIFNRYNNVAGQIMPLIGESYHYFGPIFAPILSMMFAKGAIWANERMYTAKHIFSFGTYTMFMLYFSSMLICKNFILFGSTFTSILLPMVIMCKFVGNEYDFINLKEH